MLAVPGHNSAAFGQTLKPLKPTSTSKAQKTPKSRFPYFKFYPRDWIEATRDMTLEARGAYIDLICILMEMEGHLADNDTWISHQMHVSTRKWKAVKKQLVEHEKIRIEDGKIVNERCLKELDSLLTQRRNLSESALSREQAKRENDEKHNKNNNHETTVVPLHARASDLDTDKKEEEDNQGPLAVRANGTLVPSSSAAKKGAEPARAKDAPVGYEPITSGEFIEGPGFRLDLRAAELEMSMASMPLHLTREIAEVVTRDWIASKFKPRSPIAAFRSALATRKNAEAIDQVRLVEKAKRATQSVQSAQIDAAYQRMLAKKQARGQA